MVDAVDGWATMGLEVGVEKAVFDMPLTFHIYFQCKVKKTLP
jgi:hypothetical protein|tara:strand:- start:908 stop:1033 length:126 start_codon:yes stop_codon:yes gene_type:complete